MPFETEDQPRQNADSQVIGERRLAIVHELATEALRGFSQLDRNLDGFLSPLELIESSKDPNVAAKTHDVCLYLRRQIELRNHDLPVTPSQGYKSPLGWTGANLERLSLITSNDRSAREAYINNSNGYPLGVPGVGVGLLVGAATWFGLRTFTGMSTRFLGPAACLAFPVVGYFAERAIVNSQRASRYDSLRQSIITDSALDAMIPSSLRN